MQHKNEGSIVSKMGWDDTYVLFISTAFDYAKHFLWNGLKIMGFGIVVHQIQLRFGTAAIHQH